MNLDDYFQMTMNTSFFIRVSHTGRRSGLPRVLEATYLWDGKRAYVSGYPGKRDWVANLAAHPEQTLYTVEGSPLMKVPVRARVVREFDERTLLIMAYVKLWTLRPRANRRVIRFSLEVIKFNLKLGLPWWGPFWFVKRMFNAMPCVELTVMGRPQLLLEPLPDATVNPAER